MARWRSIGSARLRRRERVRDRRLTLVRENGKRTVESYQRFDVGGVAVKLIGAIKEQDPPPELVGLSFAPAPGQGSAESVGSLLEAVDRGLDNPFLPTTW